MPYSFWGRLLDTFLRNMNELPKKRLLVYFDIFIITKQTTDDLRAATDAVRNLTSAFSPQEY